MARLPNVQEAIVDAVKLYGYILSSTHPLGRFKATFFMKLGYSSENWKEFERHLRQMIISNEVTKVEESRFGQKFIVEGDLKGPSGETVQIVSVWVILRGENIPRLVTVYPRS